MKLDVLEAILRLKFGLRLQEKTSWTSDVPIELLLQMNLNCTRCGSIYSRWLRLHTAIFSLIFSFFEEFNFVHFLWCISFLKIRGRHIRRENKSTAHVWLHLVCVLATSIDPPTLTLIFTRLKVVRWVVQCQWLWRLLSWSRMRKPVYSGMCTQ